MRFFCCIVVGTLPILNKKKKRSVTMYENMRRCHNSLQHDFIGAICDTRCFKIVGYEILCIHARTLTAGAQKVLQQNINNIIFFVVE